MQTKKRRQGVQVFTFSSISSGYLVQTTSTLMWPKYNTGAPLGQEGVWDAYFSEYYSNFCMYRATHQLHTCGIAVVTPEDITEHPVREDAWQYLHDYIKPNTKLHTDGASIYKKLITGGQ